MALASTEAAVLLTCVVACSLVSADEFNAWHHGGRSALIGDSYGGGGSNMAEFRNGGNGPSNFGPATFGGGFNGGFGGGWEGPSRGPASSAPWQSNASPQGPWQGPRRGPAAGPWQSSSGDVSALSWNGLGDNLGSGRWKSTSGVSAAWQGNGISSGPSAPSSWQSSRQTTSVQPSGHLSSAAWQQSFGSPDQHGQMRVASHGGPWKISVTEGPAQITPPQASRSWGSDQSQAFQWQGSQGQDQSGPWQGNFGSHSPSGVWHGASTAQAHSGSWQGGGSAISSPPATPTAPKTQVKLIYVPIPIVKSVSAAVQSASEPSESPGGPWQNGGRFGSSGPASNGAWQQQSGTGHSGPWQTASVQASSGPWQYKSTSYAQTSKSSGGVGTVIPIVISLQTTSPRARGSATRSGAGSASHTSSVNYRDSGYGSTKSVSRASTSGWW